MANSQKLKIATVLLTVSALLYQSLTQRSPLLLLSTPGAVPDSHACKVHHPDLLSNCEDFARLPSTSYVFLSCDRGRREWYHALSAFPSSAPKGEIFLWDYAQPAVAPVLLSTADSLGNDFHPLGISAVTTSPTTARLFIANQAKSSGSIEVLDVNLDTRTALHSQTLRHGGIWSPNGVAAVDASSLFVTNDAFFSRRWRTGLLLEVLLGLPGGNIVHVSVAPTEVSVDNVARVSFANGIAVDKANAKLYVASSTHGLYTYAILDPSTTPHRAAAESFVRTPFAADNVLLDGSTVYVSGIPSIRNYFANMLGTGPLPASWTLQLLGPLPPRGENTLEVALRRVDPANSALRKEEWRWKSVFWDDGKFFGGVSSAAVVSPKGTFLASSVLTDGVLLCERVLERIGKAPKPEVKDKEEL